jgi:HEAT repeat protein
MMPRTVAACDATAAVQALAHLTDSRALLAAARDPGPDVAHVALSRIAELDDRSAVTALRELLWSCDLAVARAVATTLAQLDDEELEACARRRLGDARYPARLGALWTLEILGDRDAAGAVEPLIEDPISGVRARPLRKHSPRLDPTRRPLTPARDCSKTPTAAEMRLR